MANITSKIKTTWLKCMESLGQSASNMAEGAKQKLSELNMENRRRELTTELPAKAMQLWQDGVELPEELCLLLTEMNDLDAQLAAIRAEREAKKAKPKAITNEPVVEEATEEAPACECEAPCECEAACECEVPCQCEAACECETACQCEEPAAEEAVQSENTEENHW